MQYSFLHAHVPGLGFVGTKVCHGCIVQVPVTDCMDKLAFAF